MKRFKLLKEYPINFDDIFEYTLKPSDFYGYDWMVDSLIENGYIKENKEMI